ncbi:restriction endonuclease [Streptomyces sp. KR55]|uniref:restriction endonuclease n=1 Tax=Streptomyces sp. KR55 TaxID=3457425 RepID=UPI003FD00C96
MLDFTELSQNGEDLELLVREIAVSLGFKALWSGRGPDGGRDLILEEPGSSHLGAKVRRWLVSCKHTAHANQGKGRSVGIDDVGADGGIVDAVHQHQAHAYLLVCSTQPSSAVVGRLEAIERNRGIPTRIWDGVDLERLLDTTKGWAIAQRFMPKSAEGWKIISTSQPNQYIGLTRGYYIRIANRIGSFLYTGMMDACLDTMQATVLPPGHELRPRAVYYDDNKASDMNWIVDYLYEGPKTREALLATSPPTLMQLQKDLRRRAEQSENHWGLSAYFNLRPQQVSRGHDHFDPDHYDFYERIPWIFNAYY